MTRVGIADDSLVARQGVATLLELGGFTVSVQAGSGAELVAAIGDDPPDAVVLDIRMPPTFTDEGVRAAEALRVRFPTIGVLLLSTYADAEYAAALLRVGRSGVGYLVKDRIDDVEKLTDAIRRVVGGESAIDPDIVAELVNRESARLRLAELTRRERQVLQLMAEGRSNNGIARLLHLAPSTVEQYVTSTFSSLQLPNEPDDNRRVAAVLLWLQAAAQPGDPAGRRP